LGCPRSVDGGNFLGRCVGDNRGLVLGTVRGGRGPAPRGGRVHRRGDREERLLQHDDLDPTNNVGDEVVHHRGKRHQTGRQHRPHDGAKYRRPEEALGVDKGILALFEESDPDEDVDDFVRDPRCRQHRPEHHQTQDDSQGRDDVEDRCDFENRPRIDLSNDSAYPPDRGHV
jgi:hypothetical protein